MLVKNTSERWPSGSRQKVSKMVVYYSRILQTGIQSLLAVACGWCCGRWGVVEAEPTVAYTNTLVLRFCIPCLQIWLLAVKTDMQRAENWRALLAFLLWSLGLQALLALHQLVTRQRLQLDRLGVDGLILTTNNTGILGPVVLEAAVGAQYAPLGMLATVVLYFQQLPLAQLLFQLHQRQHTGSLTSPAAAALAAASGRSKVLTSPQPSSSMEQSSQAAAGHSHPDGSHFGDLRHLRHAAAAASGSSSSQTELVHLSHGPTARSQPPRNGFGSADSLAQHGAGLGGMWDLEHQQQQQHGAQQQSQHPGPVSAIEGQPLLNQGCMPQHQQQQSVASYTLSLLLKNPLVWSTAIAVLLSALGSAAVLDPNSPLALQHLAFVDALLGWFAQTTAPLTLFTTGLWMYSNSQQQQQQQQGRLRHSSLAAGVGGATSGDAAASVEPYGSKDVAWRDVAVYLALRATLAPALMVWVCWLMGFAGGLAYALVILSLLPVAQTAFVVCKQAEAGMAAVSLMLVASLFMMLPQLMLVLALLEAMGVFPGGVTAAQIVG